jgi:MinD superfamily P-loop ATPase
LHDLRLAVQIAHELDIPMGVVINRDGSGDSQAAQFCQSGGIPILMRVPFERKIAEGVARGKPLVDIHPEYVIRFRELYLQITD